MDLTRDNMSTANVGIKKEVVNWLLVLCPLFVYMVTVAVHALNYPFEDDFNAILEFLNHYQTANGKEKMRLLFTQHNEHRILFSRIIYVLYNYLPGQLNFKWIIYIGNAQHVLSFFVCLHFIRKLLKEKWFLSSFICSLCFFDLANWENAYSPMGSVANYSIVFLFFTSLYFYSKQGVINCIAAFLFQVIALYSLGNGIFACCFIFAYNILNFDKTKAIISGLACVVFIPLNFLGYSLVGSAHLEIKAGKVAAFFLRTMSGHTEAFILQSALPLVLGSLLLLSAILLFPIERRFRIKKEYAFFVVALGFCLTSCAVTSYFRSAVLEIPSYRYLVYPHIIWGILYIFLVAKRVDKIDYKKVYFFATYIFVINYMVNVRVGLVMFDNFRRWVLSEEILFPVPDQAKAIWNTSCKLNIYCVPPNHGR